MENRLALLLITALAPMVWGSSYFVTTQFLPSGIPLWAATLRALPAGLLMLAFVHTLPRGVWWARVFVLGALNFTVFWAMLFVSAYRLPGGVAATVGSLQPMIVLILSWLMLSMPLTAGAIAGALAGFLGVLILVLGPEARFDPVGIIAGLAGAGSMALGVVLTKRWQPRVSAVTLTAWQLTAGGLMLLPLALIFEGMLPLPTLRNLAGYAWLAIPGAAISYVLFFRGLSRLGPATVSPLGLLSPVTATVLGWVVLGQRLSTFQLLGMALVAVSVWVGQAVQRKGVPAAAD